MDNYREKIVRIVERELKRTEEYQQRRDEYGNEEYILGCIMVKKMSTARTANYTRADRTAIGHEVEVRYIAELLV